MLILEVVQQLNCLADLLVEVVLLSLLIFDELLDLISFLARVVHVGGLSPD